MAERILDPSFVEQYKTKTPPWGFNSLGEVVFKRTYARDIDEFGTKEEWYQTIERCIQGAQDIGADYTIDEAERLFDYIFNLKGSFAGRALWQLGTDMVDQFGGTSLVNCWATTLDSVEGFKFLMDHLMLGGGVGFSVERSQIYALPKIKKGVSITHESTNDADFIVADSRRGWSTLLEKVFNSFFHNGDSFSYSTILVRRHGAPLKTFGGTASGPEVLIEGIAAICKIFASREGKRLRSIDVLDICNIIGMIVVAGSARRSAEIALGDPDDYLYLAAKNWSSGTIPSWRGNSNNSIMADSYDQIIDRFWKNYSGDSEPYGLVNLDLMKTMGRLGEPCSDHGIIGCNPCAEIGLEDGEPCNLAEIFLPNINSMDELIDLSKLLYKTQKAITGLWYPYEKTRKVIAKNRRIGLGITGWLQASTDQLGWLDETYRSLKAFDKEWSKTKGISTSIKLTTTKPSGTLSLLAGVTPGIHPGYSKYHIRRIRFGSSDPLVEVLRQRGHNIVYDIDIDGSKNHSRFVVDFPCTFPDGTVLANELTAIDQLEWVVKAQTLWSDNAVSVTVYYTQEELPEIKAWLEENYEDKIKSVSFLLKQDHGFILPPLEEITEAEYDKSVAKLDLSISLKGGGGDLFDIECEGGACPIR